MIGPNTHCPSIFLTFLNQRSKNLVQLKAEGFNFHEDNTLIELHARYLFNVWQLAPCLLALSLCLDKLNFLQK